MTQPPHPHDQATPTAEEHLDQAAAHLAAAAELLEAGDTSEQVFSPARSLAAQLQLIGHGISPGIAPATGAFAPVGTVAAHVDYALSLIDSFDPATGPADLLVWCARLTDLRSRVASLTPPGS